MTAYRPAAMLILAVWFLQLSGGMLSVLTPLGLTGLGLGAGGVGLVAAMHAAGFMVGAAIALQLVARIGNIRAFSAAASVTAMTTLVLPLVEAPVFWGAIRILQGASFAVMFAALEGWLGLAVSAEHRGGVTGVYHVVAKAALMIGPLLISGFVALAPEPFVISGIFMMAALLPMCLTRQDEPPFRTFSALSLPQLVRLAPSAAIGVFLAGVINTGVVSLLPVFMLSLAEPGQGPALAAYAFAAANVGGLVSQWPLGRLSDRMDRRTVIAGMALVAALCAVGIAFAAGAGNVQLTLVALGLWGAGSLSFYGISVAHAIDRAPPDKIASAMSGLLFIWAGGAVIGPLLSGIAMSPRFGPHGLFYSAAALLLVLAIAMVVRRGQRSTAPDANQEDWSLTQPTSLAGVELDPRT